MSALKALVCTIALITAGSVLDGAWAQPADDGKTQMFLVDSHYKVTPFGTLAELRLFFAKDGFTRNHVECLSEECKHVMIQFIDAKAKSRVALIAEPLQAGDLNKLVLTERRDDAGSTTGDDLAIYLMSMRMLAQHR